jgi:transposase
MSAIGTLPEKMYAVIEALQSLRGIAKISAVSIMAEVGELSRFEHARQLMGYSGAVSWEDSSGPRVHRGGISKAGNAHLRRIVVEAAWAYRHRPGLGATLLARQREQSEDIKAIAWKAQHRLHSRYATLLAKGKLKQKVITAVGRELLGFIWAIGVAAENSHAQAGCLSLTANIHELATGTKGQRLRWHTSKENPRWTPCHRPFWPDPRP